MNTDSFPPMTWHLVPYPHDFGEKGRFDIEGTKKKLPRMRLLGLERTKMPNHCPWKIEWDLANGPLRKLLELLDTEV